MSIVVLDTETTSKYPSEAECLEVTIIDHTGAVLLTSLVKPARAKSWPEAQRIHGISPADVREAPALATLTPRIAELLSGRTVVIYNATYDTTVLREAFALATDVEVRCCMLAFSEYEEVRVWNSYHGNWRWQSLATAAAHVGHVWQGEHHRAEADCHATRDVWNWVTDPVERQRLDEAKARRQEAKELAWHLRDVFGPLEQAEEERLRRAGWAWERAHYPAMGVWERRGTLPESLIAEKAADVFTMHHEGTTARAWNRYGEKWLRLPRHARLDELPADLTSGCPATKFNGHLLPAAGRLKPAALLVYGPPDSAPHEWLDAKPLYKKRSLRRGVHYVPISYGYEPWPEGHYSKTTLAKQFKLKPAQIEQMRPAYLRSVRSGKYYENDYLLYAYTPPSDENAS